MRVVHLCRVAPPSVGGMEAAVDGLSALQSGEGHDVRIVTTQPPPLDQDDAWLTDAGVPVIALPRAGPRRYPLARGLAPLLQDVDVVHVHGVDGLADQALTLRHAGVAVGLSTHGGYLHTRRQWWLKQAWLRTGTRASLARADAIWFTSEADRVALAPAHLSGPVVPNGVELRPFRAVRSRRRPRAGHWLVLGRVDHHKGMDRLLRTIAQLGALGGADVVLHVVGPLADERLGRDLRALAQAEGVADRVCWRGALSREDLLDELVHAELAVFPSQREGFGIALVEVMAAGVPVAVQPIPAFCEKVEDGREGLRVDFADPVEAARRLSAWRRADRAGVGAAGARRAEAWSWEAVGPRWAEAYERLLERR